jgi:hypothetical protein
LYRYLWEEVKMMGLINFVVHGSGSGRRTPKPEGRVKANPIRGVANAPKRQARAGKKKSKK